MRRVESKWFKIDCQYDILMKNPKTLLIDKIGTLNEWIYLFEIFIKRARKVQKMTNFLEKTLKVKSDYTLDIPGYEGILQEFQ